MKVTTLPPVGPDTASVPGAIPGFLIVYTATEAPMLADGGPFYYPHTSYVIYDSHGRKVRWVTNHLGSTDETPSRVRLPAGNYIVRAESEIDGPVAVPVIIKKLRITTVNLEKHSHDSTGS